MQNLTSINCHVYLPLRVLCVGEEAKRVYDDAQALLNRLINSKGLQARGIVGFWRAQSHGDDILVYANDVTPTLSNRTATFHGLRQQVTLHSGACEMKKKNWEKIHLCII